jgi:hypothetical protein
MKKDDNHIYDTDSRDREYWTKLDQLFESRGYKSKSILRNWPAYVMRRDIRRFLSHYELFKKTVDLPGCIIDLGVYKGASLFTWSNLLEIFCANDRSKKVFGFDHFQGLQNFNIKDGAFDAAADKLEGGFSSDEEDLRILQYLHSIDNHTPGSQRVELVVGDIKETLPIFLKDNPGLRISFLHFDFDIYEPTKFALEQLYPLVVKGGVVCFDEYGLMPWEGESAAVDEYLAGLNEKPTILKHSFTQMPHGYMVK